ncbi:MAG TPA: T3SS effector HopA1 family protein [bacterium]|nr:T3SS effector HopA1 family protein [bacterium]
MNKELKSQQENNYGSEYEKFVEYNSPEKIKQFNKNKAEEALKKATQLLKEINLEIMEIKQGFLNAETIDQKSPEFIFLNNLEDLVPQIEDRINMVNIRLSDFDIAIDEINKENNQDYKSDSSNPNLIIQRFIKTKLPDNPKDYQYMESEVESLYSKIFDNSNTSIETGINYKMILDRYSKYYKSFSNINDLEMAIAYQILMSWKENDIENRKKEGIQNPEDGMDYENNEKQIQWAKMHARKLIEIMEKMGENKPKQEVQEINKENASKKSEIEYSQEIEEMKEKKINSAKNFEDLFFAIKEIGTIRGSQQEYSPELLIQTINRVRSGEISINFITRKYNLRQKVQEFLKNPEYKNIKLENKTAEEILNKFLEFLGSDYFKTRSARKSDDYEYIKDLFYNFYNGIYEEQLPENWENYLQKYSSKIDKMCESFTGLQNGSWFYYDNQNIRNIQELGRFYINIDMNFAPDFFGSFVKKIKGSNLNCQIKIPNYSSDYLRHLESEKKDIGERFSHSYNRSDKVVIYFDKNNYGEISEIIQEILNTDNKNDGSSKNIPLFTKQVELDSKILNGVGYGDEPKVNSRESFGTLRSSLLLQIYKLLESGNTLDDKKWNDICKQYNINPEDPSLNLNSWDPNQKKLEKQTTEKSSIEDNSNIQNELSEAETAKEFFEKTVSSFVYFDFISSNNLEELEHYLSEAKSALVALEDFRILRGDLDNPVDKEIKTLFDGYFGLVKEFITKVEEKIQGLAENETSENLEDFRQALNTFINFDIDKSDSIDELNEYLEKALNVKEYLNDLAKKINFKKIKIEGVENAKVLFDSYKETTDLFIKKIEEKIQILEKENQESEKDKEKKSSELKSVKEKKIEIFEHLSNFNLSDAQKHLIIENFLQFKFDIIKEDAQREFKEDSSKKKFFGKIWAGIKKEYSLVKNEKSKVRSFLNERLSDADIEILKLLVDKTNNSDFDLEILENGKVNVLYSGNWDNYELTAENQSLINEFNKVANEFNDMPYEWSLDTATKSQRRDYEKKEMQFRDLYLKLCELADEKGNKDFIGNDFNAKLNQNIKLNQFIVQNQDIERQIQKSSKQIAWLKAFKNEFISKGAWAVAGAVTRTLTMSGIGFIGGLLGAGTIGALRSREMGKKELVQTDKDARRDIKGKYIKNVVDLESTTKQIIYKRDENGEILFDENKNPIIDREFENTTGLINKLEKLIEKIENTKDVDRGLDLLKSLDLRISYTEDKINSGLVNFGDKEERLSNQFRILEVINKAKLLKNHFGVNFDKKQDLSNEDIERMESQISEVNRLREELSEIRKNNKENPNVEELPEVIEKHQKIGEILSNADLRYYILNDKLEKFLFSTESHIKDERRKFLLKKATQGAIISAGAFVAGYGARVLLENAGILAHNINGPEDVFKLIKSGHLTDKDIDTIFNNPKLFKNENIINELLNNKKDLTGHVNQLLNTYPSAKGNISILEDLKTLTTSKSDKAFLDKLIEENTQSSLGTQSIPSNASAIEGVVAGSTTTGQSVIENINISNMNANQIHELASHGATVTRGGSVSEALNLGMAPGSKMTLVTFDKSGNPIVHNNFDANVILEGAKIIKQGKQIFAIDEKNSYESFYKYYADHPEEILRVIKRDNIEIPTEDIFSDPKPLNVGTMEDLNVAMEDLPNNMSKEVQIGNNKVMVMKDINGDLYADIDPNNDGLERITSEYFNGLKTFIDKPKVEIIQNLEDLQVAMQNVEDHVPTTVNIGGREIVVMKEGSEYYADIKLDIEGLEKITPEYFNNNSPLVSEPVVDVDSDVIKTEGSSGADSSDRFITLNSGEVIENVQNRPLTTNNINYQDLINGDRKTIKEFIQYNRPGGLSSTGYEKDLSYDLDTIYYNTNLSVEDKVKILTNIKNELEDYPPTNNQSFEQARAIIRQEIDTDISLLHHQDKTPILANTVGVEMKSSDDVISRAFDGVEDESKVLEVFYNPTMQPSEKISLIASYMKDISDGGSANFGSMEFEKLGDKIFYKLNSGLSIELTDVNLNKIIDWRHAAFSKIDLSTLDNIELPSFRAVNNVENAEKALRAFLSTDTYNNKITALQNAIHSGEQLSVGSATFARRGNDIYYVLSSGNGVKLTSENMDKVNQMLSNARQAVLRDIAEGR